MMSVHTGCTVIHGSVIVQSLWRALILLTSSIIERNDWHVQNVGYYIHSGVLVIGGVS